MPSTGGQNKGQQDEEKTAGNTVPCTTSTEAAKVAHHAYLANKLEVLIQRGALISAAHSLWIGQSIKDNSKQSHSQKHVALQVSHARHANSITSGQSNTAHTTRSARQGMAG